MSDANTQGRRRTKYGLNVAVAVLAATGIVLGLNALVDRQFRRLPPQTKDWVRFDFTATRQYSLSPQTRKVLGSLDEDYAIVGLFRSHTLQTQRVRDLLEEYPRHTPHLTARFIDPVRDLAAAQAFLSQVRARLAQTIEPTESAIEQSQLALRDTREMLERAISQIQQAIETHALEAGPIKRLLEQTFGAITQLQSDLKSLDEQVALALEEPLPDLTLIKAQLASVLTQLTDAVFTPVGRQFNQLVDQPQTPDAIKDVLLKVVAQMQPLEDTVRQAQLALEATLALEGYDAARKTLLSEECVAILSPAQVRVMPVSQLFREPDPQLVEQQGHADARFVGEERITGTLVSLSLTTPPMVVLVSNEAPALGPRGGYRAVAQRLAASNFDVREWNPKGQMTPMGQRMAPTDPPQPKPGQAAVWVVLPFPPMDPSNPMAMLNNPRQEIADLLGRAQDQGHAAMILLGAEPAAQFGEMDPLVAHLDTWGIEPGLDRIVMRQIQQPNRQVRASSQFQVTHWPNTLPITRALAGMPAFFVGPSPITTQPTPGVTTYPLVTLTDPMMWTLDEFKSLEQIRAARYDPKTSVEQVTIGLAAARDDTGARLIVVADAAWATDSLVSYGIFGPGSADVVGATFPGNGELFVNSAYWLAGLDELIAASARSQDIRRIEPMTDTTLLAYRWGLLAGMPGLILVWGVGVWLVRRKG